MNIPDKSGEKVKCIAKSNLRCTAAFQRIWRISSFPFGTDKILHEYINNHDDYELIEVYYNESISETSTKKRDGFNRMIADCEDGKNDLILTKEVSRFARNTIDTLSYTRKLK